MNDRQLGETQYTDAIMSIYGANPVASISESYKPKDQPELPQEEGKESVGSGSLYKETRGLLLSARKNLQLKTKILAYEKRRFKQLTVDLEGALKSSKSKKKVEGIDIPEDGSKTSSTDWMMKLVRTILRRFKTAIVTALKRAVKRLLGKKGIKYVRSILKPIRQFRARGGLRGVISRRLRSFRFRLLRRSSQLRNLAKFYRAGGVRGFLRRGFFGGVRAVRGSISTAKQVATIIGSSIQMAKAPSKVAQQVATKPNVITQIGKGLGKVGGIASKTIGKAIKPIANIGKGLAKVAGKAFAGAAGKSVAKKIPGLSILAGVGFGIDRALKGDGLGAIGEIASGLAGTIPGAGTGISLAIDAALLGRDLAKAGMAEGGKVTEPQIVLVGEGGEDEFIVPKSKLSYFLGGPGALGLLNFGVAPIIGAVKALLNATGQRLPGIPDEIESENVNIDAKRPTPISFNFIGKIAEFIKLGFGKIAEIFGGLFDKFRSLLPDLSKAPGPVKAAISGLKIAAGAAFPGLRILLDFLLGGGGAKAATRGPGGLDDGPAVDPYTGEITGDTFMPLASKSALAGAQSGQRYGDPRKGRLHAGIDITENTLKDSRAPVVAYKTGKVISVETENIYPGGGVKIDHGGGIVTRYLHINPSPNIKRGATVYGGQQIGTLYRYWSNGGEATHLHWEVIKDGKIVDPTRFAREAKNKLTAPLTQERAKEQHDISKAISTPPQSTPDITTEAPRLNAQQRRRGYDRRASASLAPLNKTDTASSLERFGNMDEENNTRVAYVPIVVPGETQYVPMPMPLPGNSVASISNTPAWGQGAVLGA